MRKAGTISWGHHIAIGLAAMSLSACLPTKVSNEPPVKTFAAEPQARLGSNAALTRDFEDLFFALETGAQLPRFSRFEGPIAVRLTAPLPPISQLDLDKLLARFQAEAGIAISTQPAGTAHIFVVPVPQDVIAQEVPGAACFIIPGVASWSEFKAARTAHQISWKDISLRKRVGVFVPRDGSPQNIRDCLHEEIAQALGPLNDLDRLPQSVFNDNNVHAVLTDFDMLMLRVAYDPALQSGMARSQVMAKVPEILNRLHPEGIAHNRARVGHSDGVVVTQAWDLIQEGRRNIVDAPDLALAYFETAAALLADHPPFALPHAQALHGLAWLDFESGSYDSALALTDQALIAASAAEDESLVAELQLIRWSIFAAQNNPKAAQNAVLRARTSAQYAYGDGSRVLDWQRALPHLH